MVKRQQRRPRTFESVTVLEEAEKWRSQCLEEISRKVERINDPEVEDSQLRGLNDDINRLLRERRGWDAQIKKLGGPDHLGVVANTYKYFGRARDLPEAHRIRKKESGSSGQVLNTQQFTQLNETDLGPEYYGYTEPPLDLKVPSDTPRSGQSALLDFEAQRSLELRQKREPSGALHFAPLPSEKEFETAVLELRKKQLLERLQNR
ncbi:hypothetical protein OGAPHI_000359 [Ogataea philodendri]|uniref:Pre-mRNA-splicing factor ISY1 n=1 Tax=Ogataea philodendri TaxID=1378263 RepID=A0A9P8PI36_9ASCO|nr:uncharacterized protein OGAPHI_000359 [Ogataea philodendri]KAH3671654.1 hypothetical protein OGAPHI_000359 [Ogataea philodendri]